MPSSIRNSVLAVTALIVGLGLAQSAYARADGPDRYEVRGIAYHDVLNIRKWPSHRSRIVGVIPADGRNIRNLVRRVRGWCRISYRYTDGWVYDENSQTLFVKLTHRNEAEEIVLNY